MDGTLVSATKPALASKGVWGCIVALAALLIPAALAQIGALTPDQLKALGLPSYTVTIVGVVLALYGRLSATSTIAGAVSTPAATTLRAMIVGLIIVGGAVGASPFLTACAAVQGVITKPIAGTVVSHSGGAFVQAGDTVQLSLTAQRTATFVQVDAGGAYKLSARAFLTADDALAFEGNPALKRVLQADLARALKAYRALRKLGAAASADQLADQRKLISDALIDVNEALRVAVPEPPATPAP